MSDLWPGMVESLSRRGLASPKEITADLEARLGVPVSAVLVRQTIARKVACNVVIREGYGKYRLQERHERRTVKVPELTERLILDYLRSVGGIARTRDIHRAIWDPPRGGTDRPYDYKRVVQALKRSQLFRQDYGRGYWNLTKDELDRLPRLGRWASYDIALQEDEPWPVRDAYFEIVGTAFAEARGDTDLADVAADPAVLAALSEMSSKAPAARAKALEHLGAEVEIEAVKGASERFKALEVRRRKGEIYTHIYAMFELGDPALHLVAPITFYRACADRFRVDAAELSRGRIRPLV